MYFFKQAIRALYHTPEIHVPRKMPDSVKFRQMAITVIKSSGRSEEFDIRKLIESLSRSGAPPDVARRIAEKVEKQTTPSSKTKSIHRMAKRFLKQYNHATGMKYSLKSALHALGPSGYPFEKYFAKILKAHGYSAEVNKIMEGYCVSHEVDVLARRGNEHFTIECKYHTSGGTPTDVKVALYVHSRFADIRRACETKPGHDGIVHRGWLATNTRCTTDAIKYAECAGLKITSWRYPEKESLERLIEEKRLYPVTILPAGRKKNLDALFQRGIVLAQDIADMDERTFVLESGLDTASARLLKQQADKLCPCV
jgi:hypothetical protein